MLTLEIETVDVLELEDGRGNMVLVDWADWMPVGNFKNKQQCKQWMAEKGVQASARIMKPGGSAVSLDSVKVGNEQKKSRKPAPVEREKHAVGLGLPPVERKGRGRFILKHIDKMMKDQDQDQDQD